MTATSHALALLLMLAPPLARAQPTTSPVAYTLTTGAPRTPTLTVALRLPTPVPAPRAFVMPRAVPMGYAQQPYDRFVTSVRAFDDAGQPLAVSRQDGPRWRLGDAGRTVQRVEYDVDVRRLEQEVMAGGDASRVRTDYLFVLGYSVFGYLDGVELDTPITLDITGPAGWPVFSTLAPAPPTNGRLSVRADDFYALADSQVLMGRGVTIERLDDVAPGPLWLAVRAEFEVDRPRIAASVREAYARLVTYFDSAPFPHYTAVFEFLEPVAPGQTYGFSMEHLESATFCLGRDRALTASSTDRERTTFRVNVAHHLAHAWVPKRAHGRGYRPFSWEIAPALDSIWFSEGFGQYAAIDALADGLPPDQRDIWRDQVIETRFRAALREMPRLLLDLPLIQLSYRGSYLYSEDFRIGRTLFSRGGLMAAEMDAHIRLASGGTRRLRDAFRHLMAWSARTGRGFDIDELPAIFADATGVDTRAILERGLGPRP